MPVKRLNKFLRFMILIEGQGGVCVVRKNIVENYID